MKQPIRALILDMDGVLWRDQQSIGDLPAIFDEIEQRGIKVIMATNNATRTPEMYVERLLSFGVSVETWQVIHSGEVAALYMKKHYPDGGPVHILGEKGVQQALENAGFWHAENDVLAVIASMDRQVNYEKLSAATLLVRNGAPLIGTNPDRTFPTPEGLKPGTGSILAALEAATDQQALIMGKPQTAIYEAALERMGTTVAETLVIGDRLETDIAGAQKLGCPTALVLSGVSTPEQAAAWQPQPDWILPDLTAVLEQIG